MLHLYRPAPANNMRALPSRSKDSREFNETIQLGVSLSPSLSLSFSVDNARYVKELSYCLRYPRRKTRRVAESLRRALSRARIASLHIQCRRNIDRYLPDILAVIRFFALQVTTRIQVKKIRAFANISPTRETLQRQTGRNFSRQTLIKIHALLFVLSAVRLPFAMRSLA